jgi:dTDP-4-amino-4,6-dideoxygalactose transaminase
MIKQTDPLQNYLKYQNEIDIAIKDVLDSGWYILGKQVKLFEKEFASYLNSNYSTGVANGTDALELALYAIETKPDDKVITVSHTAVATTSAIKRAGADPVFVDINEKSFNLDPNILNDLLLNWSGKMPKAIIPVHIYGFPAEMESIMEIASRFDLAVIEDCAQAHGAEVNGKKIGSFGDLGCFSFYPTKNLGALGDAGIVCTSSSLLSEKLHILRQYGWKERYISSINGVNSRLDEIQASVLRVKLKYLDKMNKDRIRIANIYNNRLKETPLILPDISLNKKHVYHQYVIKSEKRDDLASFLKENNIGTHIHYPVPVHQQKAYKDIVPLKYPLVKTEKISKQILSLPMFPEMSDQMAHKVCDFIYLFFKKNK